MATDDVYSAIRTFLDASWTTTPLRYENEAADPPIDNAGMAVTFVFVELAGDFYEQASIGAGRPQDNRWEERGTLFLHVMVPTGTGATLARQYARQLCDLFRGLSLLSDRLEFDRMSIGLGEPADDEGNYWRLPVSIAYRREA